MNIYQPATHLNREAVKNTVSYKWKVFLLPMIPRGCPCSPMATSVAHAKVAKYDSNRNRYSSENRPFLTWSETEIPSQAPKSHSPVCIVVYTDYYVYSWKSLPQATTKQYSRTIHTILAVIWSTIESRSNPVISQVRMEQQFAFSWITQGCKCGWTGESDYFWIFQNPVIFPFTSSWFNQPTSSWFNQPTSSWFSQPTSSWFEKGDLSVG